VDLKYLGALAHHKGFKFEILVPHFPPLSSNTNVYMHVSPHSTYKHTTKMHNSIPQNGLELSS